MPKQTWQQAVRDFAERHAAIPEVSAIYQVNTTIYVFSSEETYNESLMDKLLEIESDCVHSNSWFEGYLVRHVPDAIVSSHSDVVGSKAELWYSREQGLPPLPEPELIKTAPMATGRKLDRYIAEQLGLSVHEDEVYCLDGDGNVDHLTYDNPRGSWAPRSRVPDYSTDFDDATLLIHQDWTVMVSTFGEHESPRWKCGINTVSSRLKEVGLGDGYTPAEALCRAWLDWKRKQD